MKISKPIKYLPNTQVGHSEKFNAREKRALLIGMLIPILLFLNFAVTNDFFMFLFLVISVCLILFSDIDYSTTYLLMLTPFSEVIKLSFSGIEFYFVIYFAYIINIYFVKRVKLPIKLFLCYLIFIIYVILTYDYSDSSRYVSSILVVASYFVLVPLAQSYKKNRYDYYILAFGISFILSSILGLMRPLMPKLDSTLRVNQVWIEMNSFNRFMGVSWDANIFALFCALLITLILTTNLKPKHKLLMLIPLIYFGLLTYSKMFMISLILIVVLYLFLVVKVNLFKTVALFLFLILGFYAVDIFTSGQISQVYLSRFSVDGASSLTTLRSDIQSMYLKEITGNIKLFLIGSSFGNVNLNGVTAHNSFIQMFYILGFIGIIIFTSYIIMINKLIANQSRKYKFGINVAPLIVCSFTLMALSMFTNHTMYLVFFFCMISLSNSKNGGSYVR